MSDEPSQGVLPAPTACLVCGCDRLEPHLDILLRCEGCGFVTAKLQGPVEARRLYEGDYFTGEEYLDYRADETFFKKTFGKRLGEIVRRQAGGRLLEIGSAYGFFLDLARQHFDVVGFEVNAEAAGWARDAFGVDVRTTEFLDATADAIGGPVDVTVMWDVIEHLERPDRYLARVAELSKPGATLVLTTGDIGSRLARWRGRKWRLIHPPSHLHYFDRGTITRVLDNHGFDVVDIRAVPVARSWRQVLYSILVLRLGAPRVYNMAKRVVPASWGISLNTFDIMQVVARRRG